MVSSSSKKLLLALLISAAIISTSSPSAPAPSIPNSHTMTVVITNALERKQNLQVHCKDKKRDFGVHQVPYGTRYSFSIMPNPFSADYYCRFVFENVLHWFDIYLWSRDWGQCPGGECFWVVQQACPCCLSDAHAPCYPWN